MIKEAIIKLVGKGDLTYEEARTVMLEIMGGKTTPTQNAAFWQLFLQRARKQRPLMKSPAVPKPCEAWQLRSPIRGWKSSRLLEPAGTGPIPSIFQRRQPWFLLQAV